MTGLFDPLNSLRRLLAVCLSALAASVCAQTGDIDYFRDSPDTTKYAVIIVGPTVGETNTDRFRQWGLSLHDILGRDYGYSSERITLLYAAGSIPAAAGSIPAADGSIRSAGSGDGRIDGPATREGITTALSNLASQVATGDQITLYLIGHGSGAEEEAKFNIVGPDFTGPEFARLLDQFQHQDMVIINTSSASYGFSAALSNEGRVVISSTRSATERYDPVFSRYFIEALDQRNGDRDKNNRVSMLEAFHYAKANVEQWYEQQGRLASEHAGLDDNGDALFALNPGADAADGLLAEIAYIDTLVDDSAGLSTRALALKARMQELERSVFILRSRKAEYLEPDYWQRMETLLVDLAQTTEQFHAQRNLGQDRGQTNE